ncbi:MAG TPA: hypothetical protein VGN23_13085 [Verrucomicrobiae bacterium]
MTGDQNDQKLEVSTPKSYKPKTFYLPRLDPEFYRGDAAVHWSLTIFDRKTGWLDDLFHSRFRELMVHVAVREGLFCPAYCLMPDHLHLLWIGLRRDSDQMNGMSFLRTHLARLLSPHKFQPQAYDHVLRQEERKRNAFAKTCFYILANPVRDGLIKESERWPFCGAVIPGYPDLHPLDQDFWPLFWRLYTSSRASDASERKLPPRNSQETHVLT